MFASVREIKPGELPENERGRYLHDAGWGIFAGAALLGISPRKSDANRKAAEIDREFAGRVDGIMRDLADSVRKWRARMRSKRFIKVRRRRRRGD